VAPTATVCGSGSTFTATGAGAIPSGTTVTVPSVKGGSYFIDVSAGATLDADATFTVTSNLAATVGASAATTDVGASVNFTATASGGVGAYAYYNWTFGDGTGTFSLTKATESHAFASPGTLLVTLTVTDSVGNTVTTTFSEKVNARPSAGTPIASDASADVGQTVTFSTNATGGTTPYTGYAWSGLPLADCKNISSANISCTFIGAADLTVSVRVNDSAGVASLSSGPLSFTVYTDPKASTPSASPATVDLGQAVQISTSASNGSGFYTYQWFGLPTGCSDSGASFLCTPTAAGRFSVRVTVNDSNGVVVTSGALSFTVHPDPTVGPPTANRSSDDVGLWVAFTVSAANGTGGYTFAWSDLPIGCSGTNQTLTCAPTSSGSYTISVAVTDSAHVTSAQSAPLDFTVDPDPVASVAAPSRPSVDVGQNVTFGASATGGSGGLSYAWSGLPTGCSGTGATVACAPSVAGNYSVRVVATDSDGSASESAPLAFRVYAAPVAALPTANRTSADVGQSVTFGASALFGSGGFTYAWAGLPPGCSGASATVACALASAGTFTVSVRVTDSNGANSTSPALSYTVRPDPAVTAPHAARTAIDAGQSLRLAANASGGSGAYAYAWSGLPAGCAATGAVANCTFASSGSYSISVRVSDTNGFGVLSAATGITVAPALSATATGPASSLSVGTAGAFSVSASGGTGPWTYTWRFSDGVSASGSSVEHAFGSSGSFSATVWVNDSTGASVVRTVAVQVTSSGGAFSLLGSPLGLGLIVVVIALVALVALFAMRRRASPPAPGAGRSEPAAAWTGPAEPEPSPEAPEPLGEAAAVTAAEEAGAGGVAVEAGALSTPEPMEEVAEAPERVEPPAGPVPSAAEAAAPVAVEAAAPPEPAAPAHPEWSEPPEPAAPASEGAATGAAAPAAEEGEPKLDDLLAELEHQLRSIDATPPAAAPPSEPTAPEASAPAAPKAPARKKGPAGSKKLEDQLRELEELSQDE
jgi:hypothetical protein